MKFFLTVVLACLASVAAAEPLQLASRAGDTSGSEVRERSAESTEWRSYAVPGRGRVMFKLPVSWADNPPEGVLARQFELRWMKPGPARFLVRLTIAWGETPFDRPAPDILRNLIESGWQQVAEQSLEPQVSFKVIEHPRGGGFYYSATDKALIPLEQEDNYKYITQVAMSIEDLLVMATVLSHDPDSYIAEQVLEMLRTARRSLD